MWPVLALIFWGTSGAAAAAELGRQELYDRVQQASAEILVEGHLAGSGCFVDKDGLVLTAAHVLGQSNRACEIMSPIAGRQGATFVAVDLGHDVVLLRVPPRAGGYPVIPLAAALPGPGSEVFLFGAPAYRHGVLQRGMTVRSGLTFEHQSHFVEVLQIQAPAQEGTSGAPWLNPQGELFGVQSGTINAGQHPGGIANVGPLPAIRTLLDTKRNAATPTIGLFVDEVWVLPSDALRRFPPGTEGVVIQNLNNDGPATRAGLQKGEAITAIGGQKLRFRDEFVRAILARKPGDNVELTVISPDGTGNRKVTVAIGCLEVGWPQRPSP
ncbi:MAG: S1C family serine protease [Planctomycetota bacterium]|nr:S1C family serine protease [Planctomycetota bacterium]